MPTAKELQVYLENNDLNAGADVHGDYQQVYYMFNRQRVYVTDGDSNHSWVKSSGRYIAWVETQYQRNNGLVFLYDVLSQTKLQITFYGNAQRVGLHDNRVVWEDRTDNNAEIFYYDGSSVMQVSDGSYPAARPTIYNNQIAFAQEVAVNKWQVVSYDTNSKKSEILLNGDGNEAWPQFVNGKLVTNNPTY